MPLRSFGLTSAHMQRPNVPYSRFFSCFWRSSHCLRYTYYRIFSYFFHCSQWCLNIRYFPYKFEVRISSVLSTFLPSRSLSPFHLESSHIPLRCASILVPCGSDVVPWVAALFCSSAGTCPVLHQVLAPSIICLSACTCTANLT